MARKNANTEDKPKVRSRPVKPKKAKTGKRPKAPADDALVSLSRLRANPRRGGRGR